MNDFTFLSPSLCDALQKERISIPTEVQAAVIPLALANKDLIVQSQTGTGKTLAYLLPLFERLNPEGQGDAGDHSDPDPRVGHSDSAPDRAARVKRGKYPAFSADHRKRQYSPAGRTA